MLKIKQIPDQIIAVIDAFFKSLVSFNMLGMKYIIDIFANANKFCNPKKNVELTPYPKIGKVLSTVKLFKLNINNRNIEIIASGSIITFARDTALNPYEQANAIIMQKIPVT